MRLLPILDQSNNESGNGRLGRVFFAITILDAWSITTLRAGLHSFFKIHKYGTVSKLLSAMIVLATLTAEYCYRKLKFGTISTSIPWHSFAGWFVISLLLVFRTNTAYDRWWEGRKQ